LGLMELWGVVLFCCCVLINLNGIEYLLRTKSSFSLNQTHSDVTGAFFRVVLLIETIVLGTACCLLVFYFCVCVSVGMRCGGFYREV
jgi:hypothetical protein